MKRDFVRPIVPVQETGWQDRFRAILHSDPLVNGVVMLAIVVGFFHGWLKIEFRHPAVTFLFDGLMGLALALVFLNLDRRKTFFPRSPISTALQVLYLLCGIYLFLPIPDSPPLVIGAAAFRGWCFATLMFTLGCHLTKGVDQVKGYFYLIVLLGFITACIGLRQTPEEVQKRMEQDQYFAERYQQTYYLTSKGVQLRVFSTFVSSGAFGSTMAYTIIFAVALFSEPGARKWERYALGVSILPMAYGIILTGSRTALISLIVGLAVVAWFRRSYLNFIVVPGVILTALRFAAASTGGSAAERYGTILNPEEVYYRHSIPVEVAWHFMRENLLGGGLGRSGYSVPAFLGASSGYDKFVDADGDLGRLMIEMGILGVAVFARVLWVLLAEVFSNLRRLRDSDVSTIGLASAAIIIMAVISFPSGSPFLGIPMGALVWFFAGTLVKLNEDNRLAGAPPPPTRPGQPRPRAPKGLETLKTAPRSRPAP